jgi:hypothetical protein
VSWGSAPPGRFSVFRLRSRSRLHPQRHRLHFLSRLASAPPRPNSWARVSAVRVTHPEARRCSSWPLTQPRRCPRFLQLLLTQARFRSSTRVCSSHSIPMALACFRKPLPRLSAAAHQVFSSACFLLVSPLAVVDEAAAASASFSRFRPGCCHLLDLIIRDFIFGSAG